MFTPRKSPATFTQKWKIGEFSNPRSGWKGKAFAFPGDATESPPPREILDVGFRSGSSTGMDDMDDWRRLREAGLLDPASMEKKDREAVAGKITRLEKELQGYQYNMGLLLIEKNEWTSKNEELRQALDESREVLKREQTANLNALFEAESRESSLRAALSLEKQSADRIEKTLQSLLDENSRIKSASEASLAEASSLATAVEKNAAEVEKKSHDAEAKLAEVARKGSELEMRLKELETRETMFRKDRLSLNKEHNAHEENFNKQREELLEWEKKLQQWEGRQYELERAVNIKEERFGVNEKALSQRDKNLEEIQNRIELSHSTLKEREDCFNKQLASLVQKEKEAESLQSMVEIKRKKLHALEEKLRTREQEGIQKILDDQKSVLKDRWHGFECDLEEKRKSVDDEFRKKLEEMEQREVELKHKEEKLSKREAQLEKRSERVKDKEKDTEAQSKLVKEKAKFIKSEEKKLEIERQQVIDCRKSMQNVRGEIEEVGAGTSRQESRLLEEQEKLKIVKKERVEFDHMQSELKLQLEKSVRQEELLLKAREDLKQDKEKFEKEWRGLNEKRIALHREQKEITEEIEKVKHLQLSKDENFKTEKTRLRDYIKCESEALKIQKTALETNIKHEQLALADKAKYEHNKMLEEVETQKRHFEMELHERLEQSNKDLEDREKKLEESRKSECIKINQLKLVSQREIEEAQFKRSLLKKERDDLALQKGKLKEQQLEMHKDIKQLNILSSNVKQHREQLISERAGFLGSLEKLKNCDACGENFKEFVLPEIQIAEASEQLLISSREDMAGKGKAEIFLSSIDVGDDKIFESKGDTAEFLGHGDSWLPELSSKSFIPSPKNRNKHHKDLHHMSFPNQEGKEPSGDAYAPATSNSGHLVRKEGDLEVEKLDMKSEKCDLAIAREKRPTLKRPRSVKAVIEEAKSFLGDTSEGTETKANTPGCSEKTHGEFIRKRRHAQTSETTEGEQDGDECGAHISAGEYSKRRRTDIRVCQAPGEKRYYLRRHKGVEPNKAEAVSLSSEQKEADVGHRNHDIDAMPNPKDAIAALVDHNDDTSEPVFSEVGANAFVDMDDRGSAEISSETYLSDSICDEALQESETDYDSGDCGVDGNSKTMEHPGEASIGKKIWTFFTT